MSKLAKRLGASLVCTLLLMTHAIAEVSFIAILKVPQANAVAFDELAKKMTEASKVDNGLLVYEFARHGERVYGYERYTDDEAHERHQKIIDPFLADLSRLATFEAIVTLTPISERSRAGFEQMGAKIGAPISSYASSEIGKNQE